MAKDGGSKGASVQQLVYSIRAKCLECMNGSSKEIARCELKHCALHPYREARLRKEYDYLREDILRALKNKCVNCCSFTKKFVNCDIKDCPLHKHIPLIDER